MQINRLLEIVYILLGKKTVTAKELAQRFGVSPRTIYRDIDTLSLSGIPVYTEKGKGGGIRLLPDFVLSKSILSESEQGEILAALQGISAVNAAETDNVLQKLSALFNKNSVNWIDVDFSDWNVDNSDIFQNLKTAILERRIAEFDYYGVYGKKTRRRVEPIQLCFKSKAWYLKAFCLTRQDLRLFKILRLKNLSVTAKIFQSRNIQDFHLEPNPELGGSCIELVLKIGPEMAYRVYDDFSEEQITPLPEGEFIVSVSWPQDDWMFGYILSYGEYAEVINPPHIRESIKAAAQKIVEKHENLIEDA
ncbi:MAG TPA: YafY family transcriptional regulator [Ruminococcaceae bacterium]|nr:YafY family transcriptional regulator [Oscillospiraceae bacterium]